METSVRLTIKIDLSPQAIIQKSTMIRKFIFATILWGATVLLCGAQTVPENTGSKIGQKEAQEALDFHNQCRSEVSVPALSWSAELAAYAQNWADYLALNYNCRMAHRSSMGQATKKAGENIFWGSATLFTPRDAAQSWYSEIKEYTYRPVTAQNFQKTGHYTQMVWKSTREVGMGISVCKNGSVIVVANYFPPGNYLGEKPY